MVSTDIINILLYGAAIVYFSLGTLVLSKNKKSATSISFFLLCAALFVWTFSITFFRSAGERDILFSARILYSAGVFIAPALLLFCLTFPRDRFPLKFPQAFAMWGPAITLFVAIFFFNPLILDVQITQGREPVIFFTPFYFIFAAYFIFYVTLSLVTLLKNLLYSRGFERVQFLYVAVSVIPPSIISLCTNLLLPGFGFFEFNWFGQLSALIMPVFITYSIFRHHLMNIRVIGTELFAAAISVIFIIQILFSQTLSEVFIRTILFVLTTIFGLFLIRGTLREVETLRRLSEAKTEFISVASHQLRSPLTAIKGYISMLLEGGFASSPEESHQVLERVYKSNERLIRLIDELLDISRIEEGRFEFTMESLSFIPFISDIVDELQGAVDKTRLSLAFINSDAKEYAVWADQEKLRQVFQNLIDNAIRYTPKGKIEVSCEVRGKNIVTAVKDEGIGMSKEDLSRIFSRFSRGKDSSRHHTEGAGLGLYIARKIAEAHKGKMWAESEGPGRGSTFYVELPLRN